VGLWHVLAGRLLLTFGLFTGAAGFLFFNPMTTGPVFFRLAAVVFAA